MPELNWYRMTLLHLSIVACHVHGTCYTCLVTIFITLIRGFCFNKLPFEISSAPEHFQKRICSILKVLEVVLCREHDVLVWPGSGGGKKMYHILKGLELCYLAVLGRLRKVNTTCSVLISHVHLWCAFV